MVSRVSKYQHVLSKPSETLCSLTNVFFLFKATVSLVGSKMLLSVLQTQGPGSPRSSPSHTISRPIPTPIHSDSAVTTPTHTPQDSLMGVGGDVQEAFAQGRGHSDPREHNGRRLEPDHNVVCVSKGPRRNLRNDLLIAADSITSTMSSLVKELNSGNDE